MIPAVRSLMAAFAVAGLLLTGCSAESTPPEPPPQLATNASIVTTENGPEVAFHAPTGDITFWQGINLGPALPGSSPGELKASRADYDRWLGQMSDLGVQFVRIYTILPPDFYQALHAHNTANPDTPLYLIQGVYLPSESYLTSGDLFSADMTDTFTVELQDAVAAVYGDLSRPEPLPGRASGTWTVDVSEWLGSWIIGAELDPESVKKSDTRNSNNASFTGPYFTTTGANVTATEVWYAARMNDLATAQATYGDSEPIAFINWPTTDPLTHRSEPRWQEDYAGVDANHIAATDAWPGGTFASYHAYPYYPDFLRYTPEYENNPAKDPYIGYLMALKDHHAEAGLPTMVTEYGVPSSLGSAHRGTLGRDHGGLTEQEALRIDAELDQAIKDAGLAGALLFAWMDEWFKVTWNTQPRQSVVDSERRALWHDPLTAEQWFGLIANDSVRAGRRVPYESPGAVREVAIDHDASYLYVETRFDEAPTDPVNWSFTINPDSTVSPDIASLLSRSAVMFTYDPVAGTFTGRVRENLDPTHLDGLEPSDFPAPDQDGWVVQSLTMNRTYEAMDGNPERPAEFDPVGNMIEGDWNPDSKNYNSMATWNVSDDGLTVTARIPWSMLLLGDPSSRTASIPTQNPTRPSSRLTPIPAVGVPVSSLSLTVDGQFASTPPIPVTWEEWNQVEWVERAKPGVEALVEVWKREQPSSESSKPSADK